jgi:hypothetical protein
VEGPPTLSETKPVLMPKFIPDEEIEVDQVEQELKKKIEITNQKIQALMKSQA